MTQGLKRYYGRNHLHFITTSCYHRLPYLSPLRRDWFLEVLEEARQRFRFVVVGYVVMPEHVHLLMSETGLVDPSVVMKWLKYRVSRKVLASAHTSRLSTHSTDKASRRDVWGTRDVVGGTHDIAPLPFIAERFWQHRFYDFNVFTTRKVQEKLDYMHMNPVKRGLVARPEDWPWSSYRCYATGEIGPVKLNVGWPELRTITPK